MAAQNNAKRVQYIKAKINNTQQKGKVYVMCKHIWNG